MKNKINLLLAKLNMIILERFAWFMYNPMKYDRYEFQLKIAKDRVDRLSKKC